MRNVDSSHHNIDGYDGDSRYAFVNWGFNVRPTEIQAAFGLHQLGKLSTFSKHREKLATRFFSFIDRTQVFSRPRVESLAKPSWFGLPLLVKETAPFSRNEIVNYLEAEGVETRSIF
jgi:CDP-6-deoxy-D-xylo-4-hexulose-3-dehydrase